MPPRSKPLVVPRCCLAMTVALEVVAEHRRRRAKADVDDEALLAEAHRRRKRQSSTDPER